MGPTRMRLSKPDSAVISGYAGWAPKQLESGCARGHWHGLTADSDQLSFESVCIAGFKDIIFWLSALFCMVEVASSHDLNRQISVLVAAKSRSQKL